MAIGPPYSKAPLTEAIIDVRVEPAEGLTLAQLESCHRGEEGEYPTKANLSLAIGQLAVGGGAEAFTPTTSTQQIGFLFKSADEKRLFQAQREGFTVNHLAPYLGWAALRDEARKLWNVYRERTQPRRIIRIAVRYVNRFDFPGPGVELTDYLKTSPEVSPELQKPLGGFLMQLVIDQPDIRATLLLSETAVPPPAPNLSSVALDIDLFRSEELPSDELEMWNLFETLRHRKNAIFEACITDKTRELIR